MYSNTQHQHYLSSMGIVSWLARSLPYLAFQAQVSQDSVVLLTQIEGQQPKQQRALWFKMIAALKPGGGNSIQLTRFNFDEILADSDQLITLGKLALPSINLTPAVTHGLHAMIQQPALKAEVWHVLKNSFFS
jgi:hypothetical protein